MIPFQPDAPPAGMRPEDAEWINRQLRRISEFSGSATETSGDQDSRIGLLEQHPPRVDNPHQTSWTNLLGKPSCPVNWAGPWAGGQHSRCDMIRDGEWTMIANKDTSDRPAPQPHGDPRWVSEIPGTPAWALQSATVNTLVVGQRYMLAQDGYVARVRIDRPVVAPTVSQELWLVSDPLGTPNITVLIPEFTPDATGWLEFPVGQIFILSGQAADVVAIYRSIDAPTSWSGIWDYKRSNGDPGEKEIFHQSAGGGREMRIHHTDDDETDRSAELEALTIGDEIAGGGITWEILSTDHWIDHVRFEVEPASRASEGKYAFQFTTYAPQPIQYNRADDHFIAEAQVQGLYSESGYNNVVADNNAYGVDVRFQNAIISPDWDLVSSMG